MNIRTKLAATALAAGTLIGGGAALSMNTAAQAIPVVHLPTSETVVAVPNLPNLCQRFPELCVRPGGGVNTLPTITLLPTTTSTAKATTTTKPTSTTKPTDTTK